MLKLCFFTVSDKPCKLPRIKPNDVEDCTQPKTFDYFDGSEVSFALTFTAVGIFIIGKLII